MTIFFFFRFFPFPSLFSKMSGGGRFTGTQGVWDVYNRERGGTNQSRWFPSFQRQGGVSNAGFNATIGNWEDWKRRRQGGLLACNDRGRELTGYCRPWRIDDEYSGRLIAAAKEGERVWTLEVGGLGLQTGVVLMLFKKKNQLNRSICKEPIGSSSSLVGLPVQMVRPRFNPNSVRLIGPEWWPTGGWNGDDRLDLI